MKPPNRFHSNLIRSYGDLDSSRPLNYGDPAGLRVYGRPLNIRQIVSWWGRVKAAWLVLTFDAVAVRWYDDSNAHKFGRSWSEYHRKQQWTIRRCECSRSANGFASGSPGTNSSSAGASVGTVTISDAPAAGSSA